VRSRAGIATLALCALVAAGCGNGDEAGTTTTPAPTTLVETTTPTAAPPPTATTAPPTTAAATTTAGATTTTAASDPTTSTVTTMATTTTTEAPPGQPAFAMAQVVFGDGAYLAIANVGTGTGTTEGLWLCQFPSYWEMPAVELAAGDVAAVALGGNVPEVLDVAAVIDARGRLGSIRPAGGELGLYASASFGDPAAIIDYVEWGSAGHQRSSVAVQAGMWPEGGFVEVPPETLALLAGDLPTTGPDGWIAEIGG
jgi:hypothetical protein